MSVTFLSPGNEPIEGPGADWGEMVSESSRNGLVEVGRGGGAVPVGETVAGWTWRFLKGLLEPKLRGGRESRSGEAGKLVPVRLEVPD